MRTRSTKPINNVTLRVALANQDANVNFEHAVTELQQNELDSARYLRDLVG